LPTGIGGERTRGINKRVSKEYRVRGEGSPGDGEAILRMWQGNLGMATALRTNEGEIAAKEEIQSKLMPASGIAKLKLCCRQREAVGIDRPWSWEAVCLRRRRRRLEISPAHSILPRASANDEVNKPRQQTTTTVKYIWR
jgi:hypothetical protein